MSMIMAMHKLNHKKLIMLITVIGLFFIIWYFKLTSYLTLYYLHSNMHMLQLLVDKYYWFAVVSYCAAFILATAFAIPGSSVFTMASGLLFGIWFGLLYALVSAMIGAVALFLICRYVIGSWVQQRYTKKLKGFNEEIALHGHKYLLVVRLLGILPFGLVTMLAGLTLLSMRTFAWVTFVGLVPVSLVYTYVGRQLMYVDSVDNFYSLTTFSIFIFIKLVLMPVIVKMGKRFHTKVTTRNTYRSPVVVVDNYKEVYKRERRI
jgi:uncharacterized membrane protein YdjX (TVP38/TMEM64 family)